MSDFFFQPLNYPFLSAVIVLGVILLLELISMVIGVGFSELFDSSASMDISDSVSADIGGSAGFFADVFSWIRVKKVPLLVLIVIFSALFSVSGYGIQLISKDRLGFLLPLYLSIPLAVVITMPLYRSIAGFFAKKFFKDESSAVSESSFTGKIAIINSGTARKGNPTEAKLKDEYGQLHYVMVEPDADDEVYEEGTEVVLLEKKDYYFTVIKMDTE